MPKNPFETLMADPRFRELPTSERFRAFQKYVPGFADLPQSEQHRGFVKYDPGMAGFREMAEFNEAMLPFLANAPQEQEEFGWPGAVPRDAEKEAAFRADPLSHLLSGAASFLKTPLSTQLGGHSLASAADVGLTKAGVPPVSVGGAAGSTRDIAATGAGLADFLQSPEGIAHSALAALTGGASVPFQGALFAGIFGQEALASLPETIKHPTPENIQHTLMSGGFAALPVAHQLPRSFRPAPYGGTFERSRVAPPEFPSASRPITVPEPVRAQVEVPAAPAEKPAAVPETVAPPAAAKPAAREMPPITIERINKAIGILAERDLAPEALDRLSEWTGRDMRKLSHIERVGALEKLARDLRDIERPDKAETSPEVRNQLEVARTWKSLYGEIQRRIPAKAGLRELFPEFAPKPQDVEALDRIADKTTGLGYEQLEPAAQTAVRELHARRVKAGMEPAPAKIAPAEAAPDFTSALRRVQNAKTPAEAQARMAELKQVANRAAATMPAAERQKLAADLQAEASRLRNKANSVRNAPIEQSQVETIKDMLGGPRQEVITPEGKRKQVSLNLKIVSKQVIDETTGEAREIPVLAKDRGTGRPIVATGVSAGKREVINKLLGREMKEVPARLREGVAPEEIPGYQERLDKLIAEKRDILEAMIAEGVDPVGEGISLVNELAELHELRMEVAGVREKFAGKGAPIVEPSGEIRAPGAVPEMSRELADAFLKDRPVSPPEAGTVVPRESRLAELARKPNKTEAEWAEYKTLKQETGVERALLTKAEGRGVAKGKIPNEAKLAERADKLEFMAKVHERLAAKLAGEQRPEPAPKAEAVPEVAAAKPAVVSAAPKVDVAQTALQQLLDPKRPEPVVVPPGMAVRKLAPAGPRPTKTTPVAERKLSFAEQLLADNIIDQKAANILYEREATVNPQAREFIENAARDKWGDNARMRVRGYARGLKVYAERLAEQDVSALAKSLEAVRSDPQAGSVPIGKPSPEAVKAETSALARDRERLEGEFIDEARRDNSKIEGLLGKLSPVNWQKNFPNMARISERIPAVGPWLKQRRAMREHGLEALPLAADIGIIQRVVGSLSQYRQGGMAERFGSFSRLPEAAQRDISKLVDGLAFYSDSILHSAGQARRVARMTLAKVSEKEWQEQVVPLRDNRNVTPDKRPAGVPDHVWEAYVESRKQSDAERIFLRDSLRIAEQWRLNPGNEPGKAMADAMQKALERYPDDWGITEGYHRHAFAGDWAIEYKVGDEWRNIDTGWRASSEHDAINQAAEFKKLNPEAEVRWFQDSVRLGYTQVPSATWLRGLVRDIREITRMEGADAEALISEVEKIEARVGGAAYGPVRPSTKIGGPVMKRESNLAGWAKTKEAYIQSLTEGTRLGWLMQARPQLLHLRNNIAEAMNFNRQEAGIRGSTDKPIGRLTDVPREHASELISYIDGALTAFEGYPTRVQKAMQWAMDRSKLSKRYPDLPDKLMSLSMQLEAVAKLGGNPLSAMLNLTQFFTHAYPVIKERGMYYAFRGMLKPGAYKKLFNDLAIHEQSTKAETEGIMEYFGPMAREFREHPLRTSVRTGYEVLLLPFQSAEGVIRRATAIGSYELAKAGGASPRESTAEARNVLLRTMFNYQRWDKPPILRQLPGPVGQFRTYTFKTVEFIAGLKPAEFARFAFVFGLLYGAAGFPLAGQADALYERLTGKSLILQMKTSGSPIARILAGGALPLVGVDIASSGGLSDFLAPRAEDVLGPAASDAIRLGRLMATKPQTRDRETALRDFLAGVSPHIRRSMSIAGNALVDIRTGSVLLTDLTEAEKLMILSGFTPTRVAEERVEHREIGRMTEAYRQSRGWYVDELAKRRIQIREGLGSEDQLFEEMSRLREEAQEKGFGRQLSQAVKDRVKSMMAERRMRDLEGAPKALRPDIRELQEQRIPDED